MMSKQERELWRRGGIIAVETQVYGGDVRTMSGGWESGYWSDTVVVMMSDRHPLAQFQGNDREVEAEAFWRRLVQALAS
jgi:hypothetical protein